MASSDGDKTEGSGCMNDGGRKMTCISGWGGAARVMCDCVGGSENKKEV